ncbi:MAG: ribonuclease M5 [Deltaproteobacteria bacterium]|nr:MAG: ribonuclease M5 [Deltaproteobacteria bacterium]
MITLEETIVVEGRDDESAVKRAVSAQVIITSGFGIKKETFRRIAFAKERTGVIIFTDPDTAGEQIRKRIDKRIPGCRHAYLSRAQSDKKGNIGVENASPEAIRAALARARCRQTESREIYTVREMIRWGLSGSPDAAVRRDALGEILGVGYGNAKQFLKRLNHYAIAEDEILQAIETLDSV